MVRGITFHRVGFLTALCIWCLAVSGLMAGENQQIPRGVGGIVARIPWGRAIGQAGRAADLVVSDPTYKLKPEGPYRILGNSWGGLLLVDTALARVQTMNPSDGKWHAIEWSPAMGTRSPLWVDAALGPGNRMVVLDRTNRLFLLFERGVFKGKFGELIYPESIGMDHLGRVLVKDPGIPGIAIFSSSGQWLGLLRDLRFEPFLNGAGDIFGLNIGEEVKVLCRALFKGESLNQEAETRVLARLRPLGREMEIFGAEICGIREDGCIVLAVTEGLNGKAFQTCLYRISPEGKVKGLRTIPALNLMRIDSSRTYSLLPGGHVAIPGEDADGLTIYRALP